MDRLVTIVLTKRQWYRIIAQLMREESRLLATSLVQHLGPGGDGASCQISIEPGPRLEIIRATAVKCGIQFPDPIG